VVTGKLLDAATLAPLPGVEVLLLGPRARIPSATNDELLF